MPAQTAPKSVDEYIASFRPEVQKILEGIRETVRAAVPAAEEIISYRMPAFKLDGIVVYFAAFKGHIGLFPPVRGDVELMQAVKPYAGPKGNLRFPFDKPIPYALIRRIVKGRVSATRKTTKARARTPAARHLPSRLRP